MAESYPWFKSYDAGVPHTLEPYPAVTFMDVVEDAAKKRPDHRFLIFKGSTISYSELVRLYSVFAAALKACLLYTSPSPRD